MKRNIWILTLYFTITPVIFMSIEFLNKYSSFSNEPMKVELSLSMALIALIGILLGIFCKLIYQDIDKIKDNKMKYREIFTPDKYIKSIILSPLILSLVYNELIDLSEPIFFMLAFQNGFFFQSIIEKNNK